jgi:penicillin-binding protein 1A
LLAALTKGPNYFNPDRQPARARERLAYVLTQMQEDGMLGGPERNDVPQRVSPPLPVMNRR